MLRKACGSFALMVAGELPGDPEAELPYTPEGVSVGLATAPNRSSALSSLAVD